MAQKGKKFNPKIFIKNGTPDYPLIVITFILLLIGLIMLLSASTPSSLAETGDSYSIFRKQFWFAIGGAFIATIISFFNFEFLVKSRFIQKLLYVGSFLLTLSVLVLGVSSGGAYRWIEIPGFGSFQPSELVKISMLLFYGGYLPTLKERIKNTNGFIRKYWVGFALPIVLIIILLVTILIVQNHLSVCILITCIVGAQMFVSGMIEKRFFIATMILVLIAALLAGGVFGIYTLVNSNKVAVEETEESGFNFRSERIKVWLDPDSNLTGTGWQINQSFYAIGSGGLFGVGLGNSNQKNLYIPEPHNDFIFAVVAEEIGFVGCMFIILLFVMFIWRGLIIAMNAIDMEGTLLAIGTTALIGMESIINMAVVTGTIPVTGMPLPFFSYGGTSMIVNLIAVGILISVSRKK